MQGDPCSKCSANVVLDMLGLVVCQSCGAWNHGEHIQSVWCVGFVVYVGDVLESIALVVCVCVVFAIVLGFMMQVDMFLLGVGRWRLTS